MPGHWLLRLVFGTILVAAAAPAARAQEKNEITPEEFEAKLGYQTGKQTLKDGLATLNLPATFRFLGPEGSKRLLEQGWGNPKGSGDDVLGMLVPAELSPLADSGWAVVITYDEDGYVDDKDAEKMDYPALLKQLQEGARKANKQRVKDGYPPVTLIGWAEPPTYDRAAHKLYWAKELQFGDMPKHTLNYNVRVLGRRGVLILNAVSGMSQLQSIKSSMGEVISFVEFNDGHRYTDFVKGSDKVAEYGIAGLIVGAVATKAGFFKLLLAGLLAAKKLLAVGLVALAAAGRKLWARIRGVPESPPTA
jgi:uncharacterized membrane-anchored protein